MAVEADGERVGGLFVVCPRISERAAVDVDGEQVGGRCEINSSLDPLTTLTLRSRFALELYHSSHTLRFLLKEVQGIECASSRLV
jgi:hypothetical protein